MLFLYFSLVVIPVAWTINAGSFQKDNEEIFWFSQPSTLDLQVKDGPRKIDTDEPRVVRVGFKPDPPGVKSKNDLDDKIRRGNYQVDEAVKLGVQKLEKTVEHGIKQIEDDVERKKRKRNVWSQILISLGVRDDAAKRRKKRRIRRLNETRVNALSSKPPVMVRVHQPPKSVIPGAHNLPPIVYAPPIRDEKYPPPGVGVIPSSRMIYSEEWDDEYRNRRLKRKFRDDLDDDPIQKIHIVVKQDGKDSDSAAKKDEDDEDIVRKVYIAKNPQPLQRRRQQRPVKRVGRNRGSGPIPVVF